MHELDEGVQEVCERWGVQGWRVRSGWVLGVLAAVLAVVYGALAGMPNLNVYDDSVLPENDVVTGAVPWTDALTTDYWGRNMSAPDSHRSWRPATVLIFRSLWSMWPKDARPSRFVNLAASWAAAAALWGTSLSLGNSRTASALAALWFAVHPAHVESIAQSVGLADTAAGALVAGVVCLVSLGARRAREVRERSGSLSAYEGVVGVCGGWVGLLCVWVAAGSAMFFKEQGIAACALWGASEVLLVLPAVRGGGWWGVAGVWLRFLLAAATGVGALLVRLYVMPGPPSFPVHMNPGAIAPDAQARRLSTLYYLSRHVELALGVPQALVHDWSGTAIPAVLSLEDDRALPSVAVAVGLLATALWVVVPWFLSAGGPLFPPLFPPHSPHDAPPPPSAWSGRQVGALGASVVALTFLPASNLFFPVGYPVADRAVYMPSWGVALLLAAALDGALDAALAPSRPRASAPLWDAPCLLLLRGLVRRPLRALAATLDPEDDDEDKEEEGEDGGSGGSASVGGSDGGYNYNGLRTPKKGKVPPSPGRSPGGRHVRAVERERQERWSVGRLARALGVVLIVGVGGAALLGRMAWRTAAYVPWFEDECSLSRHAILEGPVLHTKLWFSLGSCRDHAGKNVYANSHSAAQRRHIRRTVRALLQNPAPVRLEHAVGDSVVGDSANNTTNEMGGTADAVSVTCPRDWYLPVPLYAHHGVARACMRWLGPAAERTWEEEVENAQRRPRHASWPAATDRAAVDAASEPLPQASDWPDKFEDTTLNDYALCAAALDPCHQQSYIVLSSALLHFADTAEEVPRRDADDQPEDNLRLSLRLMRRAEDVIDAMDRVGALQVDLAQDLTAAVLLANQAHVLLRLSGFARDADERDALVNKADANIVRLSELLAANGRHAQLREISASILRSDVLNRASVPTDVVKHGLRLLAAENRRHFSACIDHANRAMAVGDGAYSFVYAAVVRCLRLVSPSRLADEFYVASQGTLRADVTRPQLVYSHNMTAALALGVIDIDSVRFLYDAAVDAAQRLDNAHDVTLWTQERDAFFQRLPDWIRRFQAAEAQMKQEQEVAGELPKSDDGPASNPPTTNTPTTNTPTNPSEGLADVGAELRAKGEADARAQGMARASTAQGTGVGRAADPMGGENWREFERLTTSAHGDEHADAQRIQAEIKDGIDISDILGIAPMQE